MVARLNMPISLVVVESHQHVLEHVHFILRRRLRTRSGGGGGVQQKQVQQISSFDANPKAISHGMPAIFANFESENSRGSGHDGYSSSDKGN